MCINPRVLPNGVQVACRQCWQCKSQRKHDWEGRCIAERKMSKSAHVVTLTYGVTDRYYGVDHPHAHQLVYDDVQRYVRSLRRRGTGLRFFAAGEYGARKGRAHFHLVAFWKDEPPPNLECYRRYIHSDQFENPYWGEGWSWWEPADDAAIAYVAKYVTKDVEDGGGKRFGISKLPPMGSSYFTHILAPRYVEAQVPIDRMFRYRFDDVVDRNGKKREFILRGATRRMFLDAYVHLWVARYGNALWPASDVVEEHVEDMLRRERRRLKVPDERLETMIRRMELERHERERAKLWRPSESVTDGNVVQLYPRLRNYRKVSKGED